MGRASVNWKKKKRSILEKWLNKWRMFLKIKHMNYTQLYCCQSMQVVPNESISPRVLCIAWACPYSEAVVQRYSVEKVFLEIWQNSQENTCARTSFLIKLQALKRKVWHRCFPVNFLKFLRTLFFTEHLWWLLLFIDMAMFLTSLLKRFSEKFLKLFLYLCIYL